MGKLLSLHNWGSCLPTFRWQFVRYNYWLGEKNVSEKIGFPWLFDFSRFANWFSVFTCYMIRISDFYVFISNCFDTKTTSIWIPIVFPKVLVSIFSTLVSAKPRFFLCTFDLHNKPFMRIFSMIGLMSRFGHFCVFWFFNNVQ